ncbi:MAG: gliding motility-associated C-terminal domain-containing protein [Bacteroidia bacterium]|nr:gliding motility-associated C-terminal domain-containing protein [Bacteroidia bacterium]
MKRALTLLFLISFSFALKAQNSSAGTEFWLSYLSNNDTILNKVKDSLKLYISAAEATSFKVSIPNKNYSASYSVGNNSTVMVIIPLHLGYISTFEAVDKKGILLTSVLPVSVFSMHNMRESTDGTIILPWSSIPLQPLYVSSNLDGPNDDIVLVAGEDNTKITCTPTGFTKGGKPINIPFSLTLNRGEVYQVEGINLSGTLIQVTNKKRLAVFSGNRNGALLCGSMGHLYEQLLPETLLDTSYLITPFLAQAGYFLRIVPLDTATDIRYDGILYKNVSRKKPLQILVTSETGNYISGNKKFQCFQNLYGSGCNSYFNNLFGDPSFVAIVSHKRLCETSRFSTMGSFNIQDHFVNIIVKKGSENEAYLDNVKIDYREFRSFSNYAGYSYAALKINPGNHLIECIKGHIAVCYGMGSTESYAFSAAFRTQYPDFAFSDSLVKTDCANKLIYKQFRALSTVGLKQVNWDFGDGYTGTGTLVNHTYSGTGNYVVKAYSLDNLGNKDTFIRTVSASWPLFNPVSDRTDCGIDSAFFTVRDPYFKNITWANKIKKQSYSLYDPGKVIVTATDISGNCKFSDSAWFSRTVMRANPIIDSAKNCLRINTIKFDDSSRISGQPLLKAWIIPDYDIWYNKVNFNVKFRDTGKYKVYFDYYAKDCKIKVENTIGIYPNAKVFPKPDNNFFCSGETIKLYDSSQIVSGKIKKVKWIFFDKTSIISDSNITHKKMFYNKRVAARIFTYITISDHNCQDTVTHQIYMRPTPVANFVNDKDTLQCVKNPEWTFTNTTPDVKDSVPYNWSINNGKKSLDTIYFKWDAGNGTTGTTRSLNKIKYNAEGRYKVTLYATTEFACADTIEKFFSIVNAPDAAFKIGDSIQCDRTNLYNFTNKSVGKYMKYSWEYGNGKKSIAQNIDSVHYTTTGKIKIKLKVYSTFSACKPDSNEQIILINKTPVPDFTINDSEQCIKGNLFLFTNTSERYVNGTKTLWNVNGLTDTNFVKKSLTLQNQNVVKQKITLTIKDPIGCSDSITKWISTLKMPFLDVTVNDTLQCNKNNYFAIDAQMDTGEKNKWEVDQKLLFSNTDKIKLNSLSEGVKEIKFIKTGVNGCIDTLIKKIEILPAAIAEITSNYDTLCYSSNSFDIKTKAYADKDKISNSIFKINDKIIAGGPDYPNTTFPTPGTYKVVYEFVTENGCIDSSIKKLVVLKEPELALKRDTTCLGESSIFTTIQLTGDPIKKWQWEFGNGESASGPDAGKYKYPSAGSYDITLKASDAHGCNIPLNISEGAVVYPLPDASFSYALNPGIRDTVQYLFKANSINSLSKYSWQFPFGNANRSDTILNITETIDGYAKLTIKNQYGCVNTSEKYILLLPADFSVYIPTAFSPNDDGLNDKFSTSSVKSISDYKMLIFNRWGDLVFTEVNPGKGWDGNYMGTQCTEGVYMYRISFKHTNGKSYNFSGTVTLLR